jgi:hypothetical protein
VVYYKGGGSALTDIIAGHIDVYCEPATGPTLDIQAGTRTRRGSGQLKSFSFQSVTPTSRKSDITVIDLSSNAPTACSHAFEDSDGLLPALHLSVRSTRL